MGNCCSLWERVGVRGKFKVSHYRKSTTTDMPATHSAQLAENYHKNTCQRQSLHIFANCGSTRPGSTPTGAHLVRWLALKAFQRSPQIIESLKYPRLP